MTRSFAYDLAWEPSHGDQGHQQRAYGKLWNASVLKRYGTVDAAERAWGVKSAAHRRNDGRH